MGSPILGGGAASALPIFLWKYLVLMAKRSGADSGAVY
jgi:hypothetical protein